MTKWNKIALLFALVFIADFTLGQGCSQCKAIAEQSAGYGGAEEGAASFADNINFGILYLMAIPYLLLLVFFRKKIFSLFKSLTAKK